MIIYLSIDIAALAIFLHAVPVKSVRPDRLFVAWFIPSVSWSSQDLEIECVVW